MMKIDFGAIVKVSVCVLFTLSMCFISSCAKKSPQEPEPESSDQQTASGTSMESPPQATIKQASEDAQDKSKVPEENVSEVPAFKMPVGIKVGLVPIEIELPKPMFIGTPQDTRVPNLEKPLGKPRPPFLAPEGTKNVALGKPVSSSDEEPIIGEIDYITDGDKEAADGCYVELGPFVQHVTIDLEAVHKIYAIVIWHYHKQAVVYYDVVAQVADDPDFITNVKTLFNNDIDNSAGLGVGTDLHYTETHEGKLIDAKGVKARYVRL